MSNSLETTREGRVLRVKLNRPEKRNALSAELCAALVHTMDTAADDRNVGAILLSGAGSAFCAGMDLTEIGVVSTEEINYVQERLFTMGARLAKPIVAAVHGGALGGGTGLVANCHIVIAGEDARFGLTEIRLGLWPYLVFRAVSAAVTERRALEMAITGRIFGADEAVHSGLAHSVSAEPEKAAMDTAAAIAALSPTALHAGMGFVRDTRELKPRDAGEVARRTRDAAFHTPDFKEGLRAFREKRVPNWPSLKESKW